MCAACASSATSSPPTMKRHKPQLPLSAYSGISVLHPPVESAAITCYWHFFSSAVIHGVRRSEADIDPKGLETLASMLAVPRL